MADVMNKSFSTLHNFLDRLKADATARIGRDIALTERLKMLISGVVGILVLSALIGMHQFVGSLERDYKKAQVDLARLEAQIAAGGWQERKQQSQILKSLLEERIWTAQTPGLADASFERWLRDRLSPHKLEPISQIQVRRVPLTRNPQPGEQVTALSTLQRMTAKLVLPFEAAGLTQFLADIAEADRTVVVDRIIVRAGRNARVEMDVSAFYRTPQTN